jgi:hypothetical protein
VDVGPGELHSVPDDEAASRVTAGPMAGHEVGDPTGGRVLDKLTVSDFEPHIEAPFPTELSGEGLVELRLIAARALGEPIGRSSRAPFSLIFLGPDRPMLEQRIHPIGHPTLGRLDVFLVPVGPAKDRSGLRYEAIFA